ncbi:MAG: hypothetical protein HY722_11625 [Planctomycetes bacterium]|nr:hypothetical protein [Planctomycetota bacterium]
MRVLASLAPWFVALGALAASVPARRATEGAQGRSGLAPPSPLAAMHPGEFAGTLLLGGFRALALDVLWTRAEGLRRDLRYWELPALYDLISAIQPHMGVIRTIHADTMAYDIPFYETDEDLRWSWVRRALLLLDEGVVADPLDPEVQWARASILSGPVVGRDAYRTRFASDRDLNPEGRSPEDMTLRALYATVRLDGHTFLADRELLLLLGRLSRDMGEARAELRRQARALLDHVASDHGVETLRLLDDPRYYEVLREDG